MNEQNSQVDHAAEPDLKMMAIGHLSMILQAALGKYKPKKVGDLERRAEFIFSFLRHGSVNITSEDYEMLRIIRSALTEQEIKVA